MRLAAAVLLGLLPWAEARPQSETPPTFPAATELVTVDVVVLDKQGMPVAGLSREDFAIAEEGKPQELAAFEAVDLRPPPADEKGAALPALRPSSNVGGAALGRSFAIVFDEVHMSLAEAQRGRVAVAELLKTGVADRDRVTLVGTSAGAFWSARIPEGRDALLQVLGRLQGRRILEDARDEMSDWEAMRIEREHDPIVTDRVARRFLGLGGGSPRHAAARGARHGRGSREPAPSGASPGRAGLQPGARTERGDPVRARAILRLPGIRARPQVGDPGVGGLHQRPPGRRPAAGGHGIAARERRPLLPRRPRAHGRPLQPQRRVGDPHRLQRSGGDPLRSQGAQRGQLLPRRRHRRVLRGERQRPQERARADRPRVVELLPPGICAHRQARRRPIPQDRGEGGATGADPARAAWLLCARGAPARRAASPPPTGTLPSRALSTRPSTFRACPCARPPTCWARPREASSACS